MPENASSNGIASVQQVVKIVRTTAGLTRDPVLVRVLHRSSKQTSALPSRFDCYFYVFEDFNKFIGIVATLFIS